METEHSNRIQTSLLNSTEKKILLWLAERQPKWMTSDKLTIIGFLGSILMCVGYIMTFKGIEWLWLCSFGYVVNWYGDSLDGTLARVRKQQRPVYGFYLDHTMDAVNEVFMFVGAGLSVLMNLPIALMALVLYLMLTLNVTIDSHLKNEFKLTYAKLGPTEMRLLMIIINTLFIFIRPLREFRMAPFDCFGVEVTLKAFDFFAIAIVLIMMTMYISTVIKDLKQYNLMDPKPKKN